MVGRRNIGYRVRSADDGMNRPHTNTRSLPSSSLIFIGCRNDTGVASVRLRSRERCHAVAASVPASLLVHSIDIMRVSSRGYGIHNNLGYIHRNISQYLTFGLVVMVKILRNDSYNA